MLKELYSQYGETMMQMEILQSSLTKIKSAIFSELQKVQTKQTCCLDKETCTSEEKT